MKSIQSICEQITVLEAIRDNSPEDFSNNDFELLNVLNLCYDLLTRTKKVSEITVELSDIDRDLLEENSNITQKYPQATSQLADFAFSIATKTGTVDLRKLFGEVIWGNKKQEIAKKANVRRQTIGDYLNNKTNINSDNYQNVVNACLKK